MGGEAVFTSHPSPDLLRSTPGAVWLHGLPQRQRARTASVVKATAGYKHGSGRSMTAKTSRRAATVPYREKCQRACPDAQQSRDLFMNKAVGMPPFRGLRQGSDELSLVRQKMSVLRDRTGGQCQREPQQLQMGAARPTTKQPPALRPHRSLAGSQQPHWRRARRAGSRGEEPGAGSSQVRPSLRRSKSNSARSGSCLASEPMSSGPARKCPSSRCRTKRSRPFPPSLAERD